MKTFAYLVFTIGVVIFCFFSISKAMDQQETYECRKWAAEAHRYEGYYVLPWQVDQCFAHGISIDAPIK